LRNVCDTPLIIILANRDAKGIFYYTALGAFLQLLPEPQERGHNKREGHLRILEPFERQIKPI